MQVPCPFVGVDVSKAELVIAVHAQDGCQAIANDACALIEWLRHLPPGARLAVESTGRYHQLLVGLASGLGLQIFVLNARDVYFYAKGVGARGKTDRVDAHVIARYLAEHHARLRPFRAPSPAQAEIDTLLGQRWCAVSKRTALRESLRPGHAIASALAQLDAAFAALPQAIDRRIEQLIACDPRMRQGRALLHTIVGIGAQSSALLSCMLARVPFASGDALVAYSGLDPRPHDSGRSKGRRRLSKRGDPALRRLMYLAAMAASHTKTFSALYQGLRARGLKTTEALVILARKLLRIAFAVWRSGQSFDAQLVGHTA
jgi:transposase